MNSSKRFASVLVCASAAAFSMTAYADHSGISTLDRALARLPSEHHDRDQSLDHRKPAVVGMWITTYYIGPFNGPETERFDLAIQQMSSDGNESMNSALVAPDLGNVCFGVWKNLGNNTFELRHLGWGFNPANGEFSEVVRINATFTVSPSGKTFAGTYTSDISDLNGAVVNGSFREGDMRAIRFEVDGKDAVGELIAGKAASVKAASSVNLPKRRSC